MITGEFLYYLKKTLDYVFNLCIIIDEQSTGVS